MKKVCVSILLFISLQTSASDGTYNLNKAAEQLKGQSGRLIQFSSLQTIVDSNEVDIDLDKKYHINVLFSTFCDLSKPWDVENKYCVAK